METATVLSISIAAIVISITAFSPTL
ncbi:MAG: photosystem II reaction center protein PsbN [Merismopedia sp. SIO2A8]|nr:photosystem II reaction center protein PsbN [Merismopedia sp. SIO2A8]